MPRGVTSSTDLKVADVVGMSPSVTEITLGLQTMMCCMTGCCLSTNGTDVHRAEEPMMTEIQANITLGVGGGGVRAWDKDSGRRRGDPLAFSDLDLDDIVSVYWASGRRGWQGRDVKGQGYGGRGGEGSDLLQVATLFGSGEGEADFSEGGMEDVGGELLQVAVEGVGDKEVEDQSW